MLPRKQYSTSTAVRVNNINIAHHIFHEDDDDDDDDVDGDGYDGDSDDDDDKGDGADNKGGDGDDEKEISTPTAMATVKSEQIA